MRCRSTFARRFDSKHPPIPDLNDPNALMCRPGLAANGREKHGKNVYEASYDVVRDRLCGGDAAATPGATGVRHVAVWKVPAGLRGNVSVIMERTKMLTSA